MTIPKSIIPLRRKLILLIVIAYLLSRDWKGAVVYPLGMPSLRGVEIYFWELVSYLVTSLVIAAIIYLISKVFSFRRVVRNFVTVFLITIFLLLSLSNLFYFLETIRCNDPSTFSRGEMPGECWMPKILAWTWPLFTTQFFGIGLPYKVD